MWESSIVVPRGGAFPVSIFDVTNHGKNYCEIRLNGSDKIHL